MLRKLGSYPRQNGLAVALRELGRIERTLFILDWLQSVELRRRVHAGLNKGEARNSLAGRCSSTAWGNQGSELRAAALPGQRPQPGDGGYRAVEHGVPERATGGWSRPASRWTAAAIPVAAGLGAHQPNRRLRLAAEPQTGRREVSALTDARKTLAYDFFRILRAPQIVVSGHLVSV